MGQAQEVIVLQLTMNNYNRLQQSVRVCGGMLIQVMLHQDSL